MNQVKSSGNAVENGSVLYTPVLSRILAALIDFWLARIVFQKLSDIEAIPFWFAPYLSLAFCLFYFTIGNSRVTGGRTLGKFIFGIRVCENGRSLYSVAAEESEPVFLSMNRSFYRVLVLYGIPMAGIELIEQIYRYVELIASQWVQTLHLFLIFGFATSSILMFFLSPKHLAFHDLIVKSIVVRKKGSRLVSRPGEKEPSLRSYLTLSLLGGFGAAIAAWLFSVDPRPQVSEAARYRFPIESSFSVRIRNIDLRNGSLVIGAAVLGGKDNPHRIVDEWFASNVVKYAVEIGAVNLSNMPVVELVFYDLNPDKNPIDKLSGFRVSTHTLEVSRLPLESLQMGTAF